MLYHWSPIIMSSFIKPKQWRWVTYFISGYGGWKLLSYKPVQIKHIMVSSSQMYIYYYCYDYFTFCEEEYNEQWYVPDVLPCVHHCSQNRLRFESLPGFK